MPTQHLLDSSRVTRRCSADAYSTDTDFVMVCVMVVVCDTSTIATAFALAPALATAIASCYWQCELQDKYTLAKDHNEMATKLYNKQATLDTMKLHLVLANLKYIGF